MQTFRKRAAALAAVVSVAFAVTAAVTDNAAARERWKVHSAFGQNVPIIGPPPHRIADAIGAMSGGDFQMKVFDPGALVKGTAYYDAVSEGSIDGAFGTPGYNVGKNSAYAFFSTVPFGPGAGEYLAWLKYYGGVQMAEEMYARDNIKYILCGMIPPETSGWFRKEIKSLDDLKGLKMRFFGLGAKVMEKFGVSTQLLAGGDIYPALELGTIDATEFSMPVIDRGYGFYQIAKYNYFPGWHQQSTTNEFLVNTKKWASMSKEYKAMLETACTSEIANMMADGEAKQFDAMLANQKDGVHIMRWTDDELKAYEKAWLEVVAEEIASNPDSKKIWESMVAFREKYKVWKENGYLN